MLVTARLKYVAERVGLTPLPERVDAKRVVVPNGGPPACQKVRKKLDGTLLEMPAKRFRSLILEIMALRYWTALTIFCTQRKQKDWRSRLCGDVPATQSWIGLSTTSYRFTWKRQT